MNKTQVILKLIGFSAIEAEATRVKLDSGAGLKAAEVLGESTATFTSTERHIFQ